MKRRAKTGMVAALGAAFLLAGLLPFTLLALPNPPEYQDAEAMTERGAYLLEGQRLVRLYPHPESLEELPEGAVRVGKGIELLVKSRRYDEIDRYRLLEYGSRREVPLESVIDDTRILRLEPRQPLQPGLYEFVSVKDSMYGEEEFYYFEVSASGGGPTDSGSASPTRSR